MTEVGHSMKLADAKEECVRWLAYVDRQRDRSIAVQKIAAEVRSGDITSDDGRRKLQTLDGARLQVYDGARLEQAVKVLLKTLPPYVEDVAHDPSHDGLLREMEAILWNFAGRFGIPLVGDKLASPEVVSKTFCPHHGLGACRDSLGLEMQHGCLQRQVESLRADRLPPPVMVASGATGQEGCVD